MNLTEILRAPEGKTLAFKRDLSSPDGFLRTVVAFANTSGGNILIGMEDRSRHLRGVTEPLDLEERAANLISEKMPLVRAIEEAIAFVEKHSLHGAEIGRLRPRERWSLPPAAVRGAIVNAVAHSDYSQQGAPIRVAIFDDRLEVESPGLLPFGLTVDDLPLGVSKLRNRVIGRVLHEL